MSLAVVDFSAPSAHTSYGLRGAAFLTPSARSERCRRLADEGFLVARVVVAPFEQRGERRSSAGMSGPGSLRAAIAAAVEISLALRGALPPAVDVDASAEAIAKDQLFRVRVLEATGLCIVVPPLTSIAAAGELHPDDGAALRHYYALAKREPVVLLFDSADRELSILAPQPLGAAFGGCEPPDLAARPLTEVPPDEPTRPWQSRAVALDGEALEPEELPDLGVDLDDDLSRRELPAESSADDFESPLEVALDDDDPLELDEELEDERNELVAERLSLGGADDEDLDDDDDLEGRARHDDESDLAEEDIEDLEDEDLEEGEPTVAGGIERGRVIQRDPLAGIDDLEDDDLEDELVALEPPGELVAPPSIDECERHCRALEAARGPKPVRVIEELFRTRYLPLRQAMSRGLKNPGVAQVVEEWRASFERSYTEGFKTMRLTGKRPPMVLDAPDIAGRITRAHGARATQLLLVDAMRFDLGQRVKVSLADRLEGSASCVEEMLLWSALPATTKTQMRLLSQGPRGLREAEPPSERGANPAIHRDGSLTTLRRVRIGQRDLVKLDVVEARLREGGPGYDTRLERMAEEIAGVVAAYAASLPPRTLLFIFGDHGFELPVLSPTSTGAGEQGGASPDEILVGAQAWLLGAG